MIKMDIFPTFFINLQKRFGKTLDNMRYICYD